METVKKLFGAFSNFLVKNGITILAVLVCATFFLFNSLVKDMKHAAKLFEQQAINMELAHDLEDSFSFIELQSQTAQKKELQLERANEVLRMQSIMIDKMIERLKQLKAWPLEIKPIDPDRAS